MDNGYTWGTARFVVREATRKYHISFTVSKVTTLISITNICTAHQLTTQDEMDRACGMYGEKRGTYGVLVGKTEEMRPLGRPRSRWDDNIKIKFQEGAWGQ